MVCEEIEEAEMLLSAGDLILKEAATLRRQGNIIKAQAHSMRSKALAACNEKPDNVDQETWERHRCVDS